MNNNYQKGEVALGGTGCCSKRGALTNPAPRVGYPKFCSQNIIMTDAAPHPWIQRVVASEEQIRLKIKELAARINEDYKVCSSTRILVSLPFALSDTSRTVVV